jgi:hypothetical protein
MTRLVLDVMAMVRNTPSMINPAIGERKNSPMEFVGWNRHIHVSNSVMPTSYP